MVNGKVMMLICQLHSSLFHSLSSTLWLPRYHLYVWFCNPIRTSQYQVSFFFFSNFIINFSPQSIFFYLCNYFHFMWVSIINYHKIYFSSTSTTIFTLYDFFIHSTFHAKMCLSIITSWLDGVYANKLFCLYLD